MHTMTQQQRRLKGTRGALAAILALIALTGRPSAAQELTGRFETIGAPVRGITADGRLVGFYFSGPEVHGFLLDGQTVTTIDVPFAQALVISTAQGINARGDVVGIWELPSVTTPGAFNSRGYLLEAYGGFSEISVPGGVQTTRPRGINASGEIVGWFRASGLMRGFIRDRAGEYRSIEVPGATHTHAHSINDRGDIVGKYFIGGASPFNLHDAFASTSTTGSSHGFLLTEDGYNTLDVPFPGGFNTGAFGINAAGDIVGCYTAAAGRVLTFVRDRHGEYRSFEAPGASYTCAVAINAGGDIAGNYVDANGVGHGFVLYQPKDK
jgi:uncharacterized membrane protein